jgi:dTDP-4-dehydrorhamnose reductase
MCAVNQDNEHGALPAKRIAVVGALGRLGSRLVGEFGSDAVALDLPEFDLTDRQCVARRLAQLRPEVVVNAAAYTRVDQAEAEPAAARAVNVEGVAYLVEACRRLGATLVQISTDYVFGGDAARTTPYVEADEPAPVNVYGRTKLEAERLAATWERHLIVRTSGLYGPAAPRARADFVETMLRLADAGRPIRVVDDQHSSPSYAPHVARAAAFLVRANVHGTYHVVNRGATAWYGFAAELFRLLGRRVELAPIRAEDYAAAAPRPRYSVLDPGRCEALPGHWPLPSWQEALAEHVWGAGGGGRGARARCES